MTTYYLTPLYGSKAGVGTASGALTATTTYFYNGPSIKQEGDVCTRIGSFTGTLATTDTIKLASNLRDGEYLIQLDIAISTDPDSGNDITMDIGTTTDPDGILNDSTGFQGATDINISRSGQAVPGLVAVNGDEYLLTVTNATENSAVYTFTIVTGV